MGAGVQSSTIALMAASGEGPVPDLAIFADTQDEPRHSETIDPQTGDPIGGGVYGWLDWLEKRVPFPIHRVTAGDLMAETVKVVRSQKSGRRYLKGKIPAFVANPDGKLSLLGRKCTADFKIVPFQRKVKELCGVKRGGKKILANCWLGISTDEAHRMKPARVPYIFNTYPLIDQRMSRAHCLNWLRENGWPEPPRSACRGCPFHSDVEWRNLKEGAPEDFQFAVEFEKRLQEGARNQETLKGMPFLHRSLVPLGEINFSKNNSVTQLDLWGNECEGMCGV